MFSSSTVTFIRRSIIFNGERVTRSRFRFERVNAAPKTALAEAIAARGAAIADFDGDGRLDVIVNNIDSSPVLMRNIFDAKGSWLALKLVGDTSKKTPKDAIGSTVYITTGNLRQRFDVISGAGYASQNDQIVHVGLGASQKIDDLEIIWANGETQKVSVDKLNQRLIIKQSENAKNQK
jgi:hypothetical protein